MPVKAIIVAAGMGSRLRPLTDNTPKCMVKIGDRTILEHQNSALKSAGVKEYVLINGYLKEQLQPDGFRIYTNDDYQNNQVLESLFYAEDELEGELLITYSDILFNSEAITRMVSGQGDIRPLVDINWAATYKGRDQNPFTDAELCTGTERSITAIGKCVADKWNCRSEYTGIVYLSAEGAFRFRELYRELREQFQSGDRTHLAGVPFRRAYVTHLLQEMVLRGHTLTPVEIDGGWAEIDTMLDYERAVEQFGA